MAEEIKETVVEEATQETKVVEEPKAEEKKAEPTMADLQAQLQELMTQNAKLKRASDKNSAEASEYKKKWKASMSEQEQASLEKAEKEAEREEKYNQLLRENEINKLEKGFLLLGYTDEQANLSATAQYDGDTETLFKIQAQVQESLVKSKEAEWLKSRPPVNAGSGSETEVDPFLKGFGITK